MNIQNKTVLVTGSSKGIGRAIAIAFANEGANVIVNCRNSVDEGKKVLEKINKIGGNNHFIQANVSKEEDVRKMFNEIKERYGKIDILINNAGHARKDDFVTSEISEWDYQIDNNFKGSVMTSKEFMKMEGNENLRKVINISSIYSTVGHRNFIGFSAAKAALNSLTQNMAKKLAPNVLVNAVVPGYVLTPLWGEMSEEDLKENGDEQLIQRFITSEEVADSVMFLTKNDAMTGALLVIDGGLSLKTMQ